MMSKQPFSVSPHSNTMRASSSNHLQNLNQNQNPNPNPNPSKKKRNLPGTPDPDSEVIAMSPKSLMATNRFLCEICNKGFQRDQNLQLHRRGHNLPWKLKQRANKDQIRKKVYVCPEKSCVHHEPSRALGDLTGIKKHYSRKHGEKKWKCEKCNKKYAVQSDWKAHSKICGTREYKCDCGTIFSRRDSFITHRAFCEVLTEQSAKISIPTVPRIFHNDHFTSITQTPRIPQIFPGFQFHSEFVGSGTSSSLWPALEQSNFQQLHPSSSDVMQTMDVFGSQAQTQTQTQTQMQWLNYNSNNNNNLSSPMMLHGVMKQEEEENKDLSHSVISSLYLSSNQNQERGSNHMSAAATTTSLLETESQMGSTRTVITNDNNNNNNDTLFNNVNHFSIVDKFYKQGHHHHESEDLNELVNLEGSSRSNFGGEYALNDSFGTVNGTKSLDHVMMLVDRETRTTTNGYLHDSSLRPNDKNQMGFTRDFLGVGDDDESMSRSSFLQQELDEFHGMGSLGNNLQSQFRGGGDYC
ncbi:zinc finger protein BALDIBIS-like [Vicia villosa]|uniref:zinc finger protein BALDIBIS-like n=1 Tax=Vicia villosa TaxID=3911 RepID=UPI00273BEA19|nr:zinc finger protein BALDIBIS-like [Vicia villosa]